MWLRAACRRSCCRALGSHDAIAVVVALRGTCRRLRWGLRHSEGPEPPPGAPAVEIGLSAGVGGLEFAPLVSGGPVPLFTFGQGGTHVLLAVRCTGLGDAAFVRVDVTNLRTGVQVTSTPTMAPQLLICRDEQVCDLLPLLVMMGGLTAPGEEREGLPVRLQVEAHNVAGDRARSEREAVLSAATLQ